MPCRAWQRCCRKIKSNAACRPVQAPVLCMIKQHMALFRLPLWIYSAWCGIGKSPMSVCVRVCVFYFSHISSPEIEVWMRRGRGCGENPQYCMCANFFFHSGEPRVSAPHAHATCPPSGMDLSQKYAKIWSQRAIRLNLPTGLSQRVQRADLVLQT